MPRKIETVGELLHWSYANLAMAHAAVNRGDQAYRPFHYMIRAKLFAGLNNGSMKTGSIVEDDRLKMILPQACSYCGGSSDLAVDHLFPKSRGGVESGDNIVWACRSCNSSKGAQDLLVWMEKRGSFPSLLLLRRYLKLSIGWAAMHDVLETTLKDADQLNAPFTLEAIPRKYPKPTELVLWIKELT